VENLARSVSAFYAIFGAVCLVLAADPERYRPLVRFLGLVVALFGVVLMGIDLTAGMPLWWTASEGLSTMVIGALMFFFVRHDR
jgi:predicted membrane channel-forming protein YqfA (hemolysin III family)